VWVLGFVSLLTDISSEMVHSLLPLFLVGVLGSSATLVGVLEGLAEGTALIVRVFSGTLSDRWGRRKTPAVLGYGLGALSKPLFALATSASLVFGARIMDRIGKGIRGAPRDALVADLTPPSQRGAAFGLRQSLDTVGALLGPALAVLLMWMWHDDIRHVFRVAAVPAALAVVLLIMGVKESSAPVTGKAAQTARRWRALPDLPPAYWWVVGIGALFMLARFSEAFLVLRAEQSGLPVRYVPLAMVVMNIVYAASAYPFGALSDRMSHRRLLALGLLMLLLADIALAFSSRSVTVVALGLALWGLQLGITQGLLSVMIARSAPTHLRGTAFGVFGLVSGVAVLLASMVAGALWDRFGAIATFSAGGAMAVLTLVVLWRAPASVFAPVGAAAGNST
jgi:MFS family permease